MTIDFAETGEFLKAERIRRSLSVQELAERTGLKAHRIRAIESGATQPSIGVLFLFAKALGIYLEIGIGALSLRKWTP